MAPEVVLRKLKKLRLLLRDLEPFADVSLEEVVAEHYFEILHASIGQALDDFTELVAALAPFAQEPENPFARND